MRRLPYFLMVAGGFVMGVSGLGDLLILTRRPQGHILSADAAPQHNAARLQVQRRGSMAASAPVAVRASSPAGLLATWARQGIESFIAAQKILLDLTAQQYALGMGMIRERARFPSLLPGASSILELAGQGVTSFVGVQKILLELTVGESKIAIEALKKGLRLPPAASAMADLVESGVSTFIDMQQRLLETTVTETQAAIEAYRAGRPMMTGEHAAQLARRGVLSFVEAHKKFLDAVSEQVEKATQGNGDAKPAVSSTERSKELTALARDAADKFVDAQRKLLHLAVDQLEPKTPKPRGRGRPAPQTSMAALTQKTIRNFTEAQKSLLDLAVKPIRRAETFAVAEATHARRVQAKKRKKK
jgi:hypothetical protein